MMTRARPSHRRQPGLVGDWWPAVGILWRTGLTAASPPAAQKSLARTSLSLHEEIMRIRGWKLAYGVGHFLNDVCATVWFSYTLLFFQRVLCFPSSLAGIVVLTGQVGHVTVKAAASQGFQT